MTSDGPDTSTVTLEPPEVVVMVGLTRVTVAVAWLEVTPFPEAVARFTIEPAVRSACTMVCVAVQLVVAPAASGPLPHGEIEPSLLSEIVNGPGRQSDV